MAGNSQRRGATRNSGTKKAATAGTGGKGRKSLEGKGPTPKAEDRVYHEAHKRKVAAERRAATGRSGRPASGASRSAAGGRGGRTSSTHEIVSGRNSVLEALRAGIPVSTVYLASRLEADDRTREIVAIAADARYPLLEVSRTELDRLTDGSVHQGVAIQVPPYEYAELDDLLDAAERLGQAPLVVALDGVTDPRNLGAVLRSAGAFGAHGVLVPERRAAGVTGAAWKVSAGAAARVPVARVTNLTRTLQEYKQAGIFVVGLDGGGDTPLAELPYATDPLVLVVGSEGKGLSRLVREQCDAIASIPIASAIESLNAGVAAGIALYEVARQRSS
ncbi:23S rRNA (guanosine(2251)-2'-O)-methyltransferase RlmB [Cellulomonas composti]|uniref:23S rRNA (Guanosine(2251)-2'-O)-methyltransferase RlmB n=1 Tax=Cellulomonas composti TaxID=266130 RepID=A0A511JD13_9CELL|nr:23S rRNA (guanosine(2251)-2'-O)-methyltransferase RlmB [Cellulomonas composti]GEL95891.1 23S rRNA (guanosine(2251)-2'-O)-methyltransferase RlmB [Cellulomonas composti]